MIEEGKTINYDDYRYVNNYFYDYMDRVIQFRNPRDKSTYYEYTYDGQISKQTDALSNETTFQYDLVGRNISATDARGNTIVTDYDKMGRVIMVTAPFDNNNAITKTYYDKNSNVTKKSVRRTGTAYTTEEYTYDSMGNMLTSTSGSGTSASAVKYTYDTANRITSMTTGLSSAAASGGNTTTYTYDNKSYLWKVTDPLGNYEELINYDAYGNVGNKYDRYGNYFTYTYGPFGLTLESALYGSSKVYTYNSVGQLTNTTMTTAQNETASESYTYDEYGRMASKTSADGTVQTYTHDENGNVLSYSESKNNVVKSSKNYVYDDLDRLTNLSNNDNIFTYQYDANSNLTSITDTANKGANVSVTYNKANLPTVYSSTYGSNSYNYAVTYFVNGCKYIDTNQTSGDRTYYTYDTQNRLTDEYMATASGESIYDYMYEYDTGGNRTKLTSYNEEISKKDVTQYTYDANNRMTQSRLMKNLSYSASSGTVNQTRTYTYDENGNMRKEVITGTGAKTKQYGYDEFNRLKSYTDGTTTASYLYDTSNLRTSKTVNGTNTTYVWDGMNLASETTSNVTTAYTYDMTGVVASKKGSYAIVNFVKDTHGNVVAMGSNHSVTGTYNYSAFGNQIESTDSTTPFRYCGEYYDEESGLTYLRNRYYDSNTGRFINEDPVRDGLNWYVYCGNEPLMLVDPWGLERLDEDEIDALRKRQQIVIAEQEETINVYLALNFTYDFDPTISMFSQSVEYGNLTNDIIESMTTYWEGQYENKKVNVIIDDVTGLSDNEYCTIDVNVSLYKHGRSEVKTDPYATINTIKNYYTLNVDLNFKDLIGNQRHSVPAHELGHVLGIGDFYRNKTLKGIRSIMQSNDANQHAYSLEHTLMMVAYNQKRFIHFVTDGHIPNSVIDNNIELVKILANQR